MLIAITDLETTGLDPNIHEIVDVGLLLVDYPSLQIVDTLDMKVKPEHPETASKIALEINGYNEEDWKDAKTAKEVLTEYSQKTPNATFLAHNVTFDWSFIDVAFRIYGVKNSLDYHRLDLYTMAWMTLKDTKIKGFNLNKIANFLGISEEPNVHRAINGATTAYEVLKKLIEWKGSFLCDR